MEIRMQDTGNVVTEQEFRAMHPNTSMPLQLSEALLNDFGADVVFEGPQATGGTRYQYSMRDGVEQISGKWYIKHVLGPVFTGYTDAEGVLHTAAEQEAAYIAAKDAEFAAANAARAKRELEESDWADLPSVRNTSITPHLTNGAEFDAYRAALRAIVVNKPATVETWPVRPDSVWSV